MTWDKFRRRCFHNKHGKLAIAQLPNKWLIVWLLSVLLEHLLYPGRPRTIIAVVGNVSLLIWALLELIRGDSYFRRLLGAGFLVYLVVRIFTM